MRLSQPTRRLIRFCIWTILVLSAIVDGGLGEAAISGSGHVGMWDAQGHIVFPSAQPELWLQIMGFILFQGVLVAVLIGLREPKVVASSIL